MDKNSLHNEGAMIAFPTAISMDKTTHLAIGAHADDLEIMAYHGIATCYDQDDKHFSGITVTNGVGSPQSEEMRLEREELRRTRQAEQNAAAKMGRYGFIAQLDYESSDVKDGSSELISELTKLIQLSRPEHIYLHQPADKHPTHIAVLKACIESLKNLPENDWPQTLLGCEVWRDLDWLPDEKKVYLATDSHPELAREIIDVFQSQISAGTDYVNGSLGRRLSNGTFADPHVVRQGSSFTLAIDLMPVLRDSISLAELILEDVDQFRLSVEKQLRA